MNIDYGKFKEVEILGSRKVCPYCLGEYDKTKNNFYSLGLTLTVCPHCKKLFWDFSKYEWEFLS